MMLVVIILFYNFGLSDVLLFEIWNDLDFEVYLLVVGMG